MVPHRLGERRLNRARETLLIDGTVGYQGRTARFWLRQLAGKLTDYPVISTDDLPQRAFSGGENTVCEGQPSRRLMQVSIPNEPTRNLLVDLSQNLFVGNYIVFCEAHQTAVTEHVQVGLRRLEGDGLANILEAAVRPLEQRAPPRHLARGIESVEEELTYGNPELALGEVAIVEAGGQVKLLDVAFFAANIAGDIQGGEVSGAGRCHILDGCAFLRAGFLNPWIGRESGPDRLLQRGSTSIRRQSGCEHPRGPPTQPAPIPN